MGSNYESDRLKKDLFYKEKRSRRVYSGIHVFTRRPKINSDDCCKRIRVECQLKDLVAVGTNNEAVFMEVYIPNQQPK